MRVGKRTGVLLLCSLLVLPACAVLTPSGLELRSAEGLFHDGKYGEAAAAYRKVIRNHPGSSSAAEARFNLGRTLAWQDNPHRDYSQAYTEFDEFLRLHPDHAWAPEARTWRSMLKTIDDLKKSIDQLKKLDIKHEERRRRRR